MDFTKEFLISLDRWQEGWNEDFAEKHKRAAALSSVVSTCKIPSECLTCDAVCFRKIDLKNDGLWELGETLKIKDSVSSWTLDFDIAKEFGGGPHKTNFSIVLRRKPEPHEVVLNLARVYQDPSFSEAVRRWASALGVGIHGINDSEREVVLRVPEVPLEEIYGIGGFIGSLDQLAQVQVGDTENTLTPAEIQSGLAYIGKQTHGAYWLDGSTAVAVLRRTFEQGRDRLGLKYELA